METQQTRARKEFKALERAKKNNISDKDIIQEMTEDMAEPESATTVLQAAAALLYMKAVKDGDTPITDAVNRCIEQQKEEKKGKTDKSFDAKPQPAV